jgi:hypothetical protein
VRFVVKHGTENKQELAHTGRERGLGVLTVGAQPQIKVLTAGLLRAPATVAIYRTRRTWARPPQIQRLPRMLPLSRLKDARPASAAICLRFEHAQFGQLGQQSAREHLTGSAHRGSVTNFVFEPVVIY